MSDDITRAPHSGSSFYSDDPRAPGGDDPLNRGHVVARLAKSLDTVRLQSPSSVVALTGPWGSGKTSLLEELTSRLEQSQTWTIARFNPWSYSTYTEAVHGFFDELRTALPADERGTNRREAIARWAHRLAPAGVIGGVVGVDATEAIRALGNSIGGNRSPEQLRDSVADNLRKLTLPVLVVVDDIDRLDPNEVLLTFKLVRLLGRLPNIYYLLAYDQQTLADLLNRTDLVGSSPGRASEYLEKMVQVHLDVPPLLERQQLALLNSGLDHLLQQHGLRLGPEENRRLSQAWADALRGYLRQPRAIKKWLANLDAALSELQHEVDFVDAALVTFLRVFERPAYEAISRRQDELLGGSPGWSGHRRDAKQTWNSVVDDLRQHGAKDPTASALLLAALFPPLAASRDGMDRAGSEWRRDAALRKGIASGEYFDRYLQGALPADDLADRTVAQATEELSSSNRGKAVDQVLTALERDPTTTLRKLVRRFERVPLAGGELLGLLAPHYANLIEVTTGVFGPSPDRIFLGLAVDVLDALSPDDAERTVSALLAQALENAPMVADIVRYAERSTDPREPREWVARCRVEIVRSLRAYIASINRDPLDCHPRLLRAFYSLRHLLPQDEMTEFLWSVLDSSSWPLEQFVGLFVPVGITTGGEGSWESTGNLSLSDLGEMLGLERVIQELQHKGALHKVRQVPDDRDTTLEARAAIALRELSVEAQRREPESPTNLDGQDRTEGDAGS